jgi:hypothetical protein
MLAGLGLSLPEEQSSFVRTTDKQARDLAASGVAGLLDPGIQPMLENPSWGNAGMLALGVTPIGKAGKVVSLATHKAAKAVEKSRAKAKEMYEQLKKPTMEYFEADKSYQLAQKSAAKLGIPMDMMELNKTKALYDMLPELTQKYAWENRMTPAMYQNAVEDAMQKVRDARANLRHKENLSVEVQKRMDTLGEEDIGLLREHLNEELYDAATARNKLSDLRQGREHTYAYKDALDWAKKNNLDITDPEAVAKFEDELLNRTVLATILKSKYEL